MSDALWAIIWVGLGCLSSLAYYAIRGSKFPQSSPRILYTESFAFGRSYRDVVSQFCAAARALVITVTEDELWIRPFRAFYVMFLPSLSDLEHRIPKRSITAVRDAPHLLRQGVIVEFTDGKGRHKKIKLGLKNADLFKRALRSETHDT